MSEQANIEALKSIIKWNVTTLGSEEATALQEHYTKAFPMFKQYLNDGTIQSVELTGYKDVVATVLDYLKSSQGVHIITNKQARMLNEFISTKKLVVVPSYGARGLYGDNKFTLYHLK